MGALALLAGCGPDAADGPPPVVLVSLDTLRADRLGAYGNPDGLTPNLDRLAAESVVFEHAYSQATTTASSHASLFSSRYPSEIDGKNRAAAYADDMSTLPQVLTAYGWDTAAFVGGGDLAPEMQVGRGFATWQTAGDFTSLWHTVPNALGWLDGRQEGDAPYLLFVHGYDPHTPYLKPTPFGYAHADLAHDGVAREAVNTSTERMVDGWLLADQHTLERVAATEARPRSPAGRARLLRDVRAGGADPPLLTPEDVAYVRGVYDGAVAYTDAQVGLLMAELQDLGVLDRAWVIVLSDHGEQLGEDGVWNHCCDLGDEETHVPLLVRPPGGTGEGRRVPGVVELVDVLPTVLELAGASLPAGIHGRSFAPALRGEFFPGRTAAYTQGGLAMRMIAGRSARGRLTYSGGPVMHSLTTELVATAALPGPSFEVGEGLDTAAAEAIRGDMVAWMGRLSPSPAEQANPLPESLRTALRAHGYFGAGLDP